MFPTPAEMTFIPSEQETSDSHSKVLRQWLAVVAAAVAQFLFSGANSALFLDILEDAAAHRVSHISSYQPTICSFGLIYRTIMCIGNV